MPYSYFYSHSRRPQNNIGFSGEMPTRTANPNKVNSKEPEQEPRSNKSTLATRLLEISGYIISKLKAIRESVFTNLAHSTSTPFLSYTSNLLATGYIEAPTSSQPNTQEFSWEDPMEYIERNDHSQTFSANQNSIASEQDLPKESVEGAIEKLVRGPHIIITHKQTKLLDFQPKLDRYSCN